MSELRITVHRVRRIESGTALRAFVDISINDAILIRGVRVVQGKDGLFISLPSEKAKDNKWYESVRCLNNEVKQSIQDAVIKAYNY